MNERGDTNILNCPPGIGHVLQDHHSNKLIQFQVDSQRHSRLAVNDSGWHGGEADFMDD